MASWTVTYSDGSTDSVLADDLESATINSPPVPTGLHFVSLAIAPVPVPTVLGVVASPNGQQWSLAVDNDGNPVALPADPTS